jgi:hypothetical protein
LAPTAAVTPGDLFSRILTALEHAGIAYMLTGSFASSYHGAPRATQDIDLVISPSPEQVQALVALLPRDEYYVDAGAALEAVQTEGQFNVIDLRTGWKVDLIIRKSRPFSHEEFNRRRMGKLAGQTMAIATAEDVIIAKLEWSKIGGSMRQIEDAARILHTRANDLDQRYVERWVRALGLDEQWQEVQRRAATAD